MKTVYRYDVRMKLKITAKRLVVEKRQKTRYSRIATVKGWLKCLAEKCWQIFTKSFWDAFLEKYGPK